jgi:eukaryotic-like serine/threonine-protein kinase
MAIRKGHCNAQPFLIFSDSAYDGDMSLDHTQQQSPDEVRSAQELSLQKTRPPAELPGYEAQRLLGRGAYGEVWIATDRNTGRRVAIKFYTHRGGVDWTLLSREVEKLAYLSADRYVVQLLEVGWSADPPYYVMEFIENGSLDDYLRQRGPLSIGEALELFREIGVGLNHAHGKGILHCDLKPANILLDQDHKPRLADFGQSRLSHEQLPALGTLFYMAPEQANLDAMPDARWDVYALGAILYRMLTGEPPSRTDAILRELDQAPETVWHATAAIYCSRLHRLCTDALPEWTGP